MKGWIAGWRLWGWVLLRGAWVSAGAAEAEDPGNLSPGELLQRGVEACQGEEWEEALRRFETFESVYGQEPEVVEGWRKVWKCRVLAALQSGQPEKALSWLPGTPGTGPEAGEWLFWQGVCLLEAGRAREARPALRAARETAGLAAVWRREAALLEVRAAVAEGEAAEALALLETLRKGGAAAELPLATLELGLRVETGDPAETWRWLWEKGVRPSWAEQPVTGRLLVVRLAGALLEGGHAREAFACLRDLGRAEEARAELEALRQRGGAGAGEPLQRRLAVQRIAGEEALWPQWAELEPSLAWMKVRAFLALERRREAALLLERLGVERGGDGFPAEAVATLAQCWLSAGHPERATAAVRAWLGQSEGGEDAEGLRLLLAQALRATGRTEEAREAFAEAAERGQPAVDRPLARLQQAICCLELERTGEALLLCAELSEAEAVPESVRGDALYWKGMCQAAEARFAECRATMESYRKRFPEGAYESDAWFRTGHAWFAEQEFEKAAGVLGSYLDGRPQGDYADEARLLLGDALLALGRIEEGLQSYAAIAVEAAAFREEGIFKTANALRLSGEFERMDEVLRGFLRERPDSPRIPEAVHWLGWLREREGSREEAARVWWEAVRSHGDRWESLAVEDLLLALPRVHAGGTRELLGALQRLEAEAERDGAKILRLRCLWARGRLVADTDPDRSRSLLQRAGRELDPALAHPRILLDAAEAERAAGNRGVSDRLAREICRWRPAAPERARAERMLGESLLEGGDAAAALAHFRRAERLATDPAEVAGVLLAVARVHAARREWPEAGQILERILAEGGAGPGQRAEALLRLGEVEKARGELMRSLSCFERVYVLYGGERPLVAEAYWQRARTLEELGKAAEAFEVYAELAGRDDLEGEARRAEAAVRVEEWRKEAGR